MGKILLRFLQFCKKSGIQMLSPERVITGTYFVQPIRASPKIVC